MYIPKAYSGHYPLLTENGKVKWYNKGRRYKSCFIGFSQIMNQIFNHPMWNTHALLLGRLMMGALFLLAGISKLQGIEGTTMYIASAGLPAPMLLAWLSGLLEVGTAIAIILGKYFKEATIILAVFVFVVTFLFHSPNSWTETPINQMMFMKNMAIVGGLLFMAAHGAGNTWRLK